MTAEARFLEALPVIDDVTGHVCRRHHLNATDADEFRSDVRLHFIQDNYAVLRQFEGRCALGTYVTVVVQRLFHDWRNRAWGRWRPSAEARRQGPAAILLEQLVVRDGWTIDQALDVLRLNHRATIDAPLRAFADTLAARQPARREVPEDDAGEVASAGPAADGNVLQAERDFLAKRVRAALDKARQALPPTERLIVKMRFDDRMAVSDVARALHLEQRPMYRTLERALKSVKASMIGEGISPADIDALLEVDEIEWGGSQPADAVERRSVRHEAIKGASWLRKP